MEKETFLQIVDSTPLVSIDLIVEGGSDNYLLGKRTNRPAQGFWFVPGGRIRKNETLKEAFKRVSLNELGLELQFSEAQLLGAYDHIYSDNFFSTEGVNTHYVALGYKIRINMDANLTTDAQHEQFQWWSRIALLDSSEVHDNTKNYFRNDCS